MREYLFRGKTEDGRWVYGSLIHVGDYCCILSEDDGTNYEYPYLDNDLGTIDGQATPVIPGTVGQFTGKYDKNGERIFEDDLVQAAMDYGPAGFYKVKGVTIGWHEDHGYQWEYFDMKSIEVIGNIHDNHLKGELA